MTKKQRTINVAVAKDVLAMMKVLRVRTDSYLKVLNEEMFKSNNGDAAAVQEGIPAVAKYCQVCALGAMVLAHIHLYDGVSGLPERRNAHETFGDRSKSIFGIEAEKIECAFEGWNFESRNSWSFKIRRKTVDEYVKFYRLHRNPKKRLAAIMRNVIRHDGEFVLKPLKVAK